ncbi:uncharacterized protein [Typha latifolia]|uniref:uncharacterized protein n=1 Tax=Typha latifolia TaxID=4733 RepID=UPI003C2E0677
MARLLQHQDSVSYGKKFQGCTWGLFHLFDFHKRLRIRRMLSNSRHGDGIKLPASYIPLISKENIILDETNIPLLNKSKASKGISRKARIRALISKKIHGRQNQKQKGLPVAPQLLRTMSIHHLECNDYVLSDEVTSNNKSSTIDTNTHPTDSSASSKQIPLLSNDSDWPSFGDVVFGNHSGKQTMLVKMLKEAITALSEQKRIDLEKVGTDEFQIKDIINILEFFDGHKELLLEMFQEPNFAWETCLGTSNFCTEHGTIDGYRSDLSSKNFQDSPRELISKMDHTTALNRFEDLKQKLKDIVDGNMKEHHRISRDSVLHKIPYGHKVTEDVMKEKLFRSASAKYYRDSSRDKIDISANRNPNQIFSRSRSLTESLDSYSHLFESLSQGEGKKVVGSLKLNRESSLKDLKAPMTFRRTYSSPESRSYFFNSAAQSELPHEALSSKVPLSGFDGDINISSSEEQRSVSILVHTKERVQTDSSAGHAADVNSHETIEGCPEQPMLSNECDESKAGKVLDSTKEDTRNIPSHDQETEIMERAVLTFDTDQSMSEVLDSINSTSHVPNCEQGLEIKVDPESESRRTSPVSVLGLIFSENPVSPVKYRTLEDSELKPRSLHFEELGLSANSELLGVDASYGAEITESTSDNAQIKGFASFDALQIQVDQIDKAEFDYLMDVLRKSGFCGEDFFTARYSLNQPVPQEADFLPYDLVLPTIASNDMSVDQALLFDLIKEALQDIHEKYYAHPSSFSHFSSHNRPKPVGYHFLKELWEKISWHLSSQRWSTYTLESVVPHDFAKNDGWLNLQFDAECMAMELEGLILDHLLDDLTLEVSKSQFLN